MQSEIMSVRRETKDTVTLRLSAPFSVVPGQFVMLGFRIEDKEIKRSYSISGFGKGFIEVTIKEQNPGVTSSYAQSIQEGEEVQIYGPFGHFRLAAEDELVLIAAGSGISPFRSYLQAGGKATLLYSVKNSEDIIFEKELQEWQKQGHLRFFLTLTRPTESDTRGHKGHFGRINVKVLSEVFPGGFSHKTFAVCGGTPFVVDIVNILKIAGVSQEKIRTEKFGLVS